MVHIMVLIFIFLVTNNFEHFFHVLICNLWGSVYFNLLLIFYWGIFLLINAFWELLYAVWTQILDEICVLWIFFSQSWPCFFIFFIISFEEQTFVMVNLSIFFMVHAFLCPLQGLFVYPKVMNNFSYVFFQVFINLAFIFRFVVHFKTISVYGLK